MLMNLNTYASKVNARFQNSASHIIDIETRWKTTYKSAPKFRQNLWSHTLSSAADEFRRRYPTVNTWKDLELAESKEIPLMSIKIDTTMQRHLNIGWVLNILGNFRPTKVVPIQVYVDNDGNMLAWDGQHTLIMLWILCTKVLDIDPATVTVPVNIYKSKMKNEIRDNYISLNGGDAKQPMDTFDIIEQMIYGVRIDGSSNPKWIEAEEKQTHLENYDFFMTSEKFGDNEEPGAISRLHEIDSLQPKVVEKLIKYLSAVIDVDVNGVPERVAEEKELFMMGNFFKFCYAAGIDVTDQYITDLATVAKTKWKGDFSPEGSFWLKAQVAYYHWHTRFWGNNTEPRFSKGLAHGMPFLIAQLKKDFNHTIPENRSTSEFVPAVEDLF